MSPRSVTASERPTALERQAQEVAVEVLMERIMAASFEQRGRLKQRIAAIRANTLNNAPEVQTALRVLQRFTTSEPQGRPAAAAPAAKPSGADAPRPASEGVSEK